MVQRALLASLDRIPWVSGPARPVEVDPLFPGRSSSRWVRYTPFVEDDRRRHDPDTLFAGAGGIFMVAVPYGDPGHVPGPIRLSQSSWGPDYHRVLPAMLRGIVARELGETAARQAVVQVDAGPLEERAFAVAMGLGYRGVNAGLRVPPWGVRVFLGLALTRAVPRVRRWVEGEGLDPVCVGCGRCLDACPTGALRAEGVVNARRCLSYVTQKRGFLPDLLALPMGGRLYGCDRCTWACPDGHGAAYPGPFIGTARDRCPDARTLLSADAFHYAGTWAGKAAAWRGRRVLQRNALNALGNAGSVDDGALLRQYLCHPSPALRAASIRGLAFMSRRGLWDNMTPIYAHGRADPDHRVRALVERLHRAWPMPGPEV